MDEQELLSILGNNQARPMCAIGYYGGVWQTDHDAPSRLTIRRNLMSFMEDAITNRGYDIFLSSLAPGFATDFAVAACTLRNRYPILFAAVLTCKTQGDNYREADKAIYDYIRGLDFIAVLETSSVESTENKVRIRDKKMVDLSEAVLAWPNSQSGNTRTAINYAKNKGRYVINFKSTIGF